MLTTSPQTNNNFEELLNELRLQGENAKKSPLDDPKYQEFIRLFPVARIRDLTLDEYCIGKGNKDSFCWWLERGLESVLGRYMPGTSKGHILYFQRDGSVYKHRRLAGLTDEAALRYTLNIHATIAEAGISANTKWIDSNSEIYAHADVEALVTMGHGRKLRLLACYHLDDVLPISSSAHLGHFLKVLGCSTADIPIERQPVARMLLLRRYFEFAKQSIEGLTPSGFVEALYSERLNLAPVREKDTPDDLDIDDVKDISNQHAITQLSKSVNTSLNQILYGPPGTGKTFGTIDAALEILDPAFLIANKSKRDLLKARFDALERERKIRFVTFHQSFSYEDFVEGLRAYTTEEDGQIRYEVADGVFKSLCEAAAAKVIPQKESPLSSQSYSIKGRNIWKMSLGNTLGEDAGIYNECIEKGYVLLGYGGSVDFTGCTSRDAVIQCCLANGLQIENPQTDYTVTSVHTFVARMSPGDLVIISDGNFKFRAIGELSGDYEFKPHKDYPSGYAQMRRVKWLRVYEPSLPHVELLNSQFSQMTLYALRSPTIDTEKLQRLLSAPITDTELDPTGEAVPNNARVLIIDEINRGNISRIFGELITLIEPSKRAGAPEALEVLLPYSKKPFSIPSNVYLIGTMNTADRSLTAMDLALRRRFVFKEMVPRLRLLQGIEVGSIKIDELLKVMNQRIEVLLDRDHCLGHAYFMPLIKDNSQERLAAIFRLQILPILQEYFFDDWEKIRWVLNDHRKTNEYYCFVKPQPINTVTLFGDSINLSRTPQLWSINEDALICEQSYLGVINHEDASS